MLQATTNARAAYVLKGVHCPRCFNRLKIDTLFPDALFCGFSNEPGFCQCTIWQQTAIHHLSCLEEERISEAAFQYWADQHRGCHAALLLSSNNKNQPFRLKDYIMKVKQDNRILFTTRSGRQVEWQYENTLEATADFERIDCVL